MKTTFQFILASAMLIVVSFIPNQAAGQRGRQDIPDLTEEQRVEMRKLKDEHFMERNRMADRMRNDRMEMRKKYDQRLRNILSEKQYYAFKQKAKNKALKRKGMGQRGGGRKGRGFHRGQRAF